MAQSNIKIPQEQIADFCRRYHIQSLAIFGSALRDDFGPDSDVDLLVEFNPEAQIGFLAPSRIQRELSQILQRPVDLVPRKGLKARIRQDVLSSAEIIYATR